MKSFYWTFFPIPTKNDISEPFSELNTEIIERAANDWLKHYLKRSSLAYRSELLRHELLCRQTFAAEKQFDNYEYFDEWQQEDYRYWLEDTEFPIHENQYDELAHQLEQIEQDLNHGKNYAFISMSELATETLRDLADYSLYGYSVPVIEKKMDGYWFDTVINTPPEQAAQLRRLPYNDYLETTHWKRIRAAMLLIHGATCQTPDCSFGDSYWLDEMMLHVHHLTYKNRGHERFEDLVLLCEHCHKKAHSLA